MTSNLALIIEDDKHLAHIFATALQMIEYETKVIADGKTASEQVGLLTPELVILDLHLPKISGEQILLQIRADERLSETRVIVATADGTRADILHNVADLVLIKPILMSQLRDLALRLSMLK